MAFGLEFQEPAVSLVAPVLERQTVSLVRVTILFPISVDIGELLFKFANYQVG